MRSKLIRGANKRLKKAIENMVSDHNIADRVQEVIVPTEDVIELY
ncbi:Transcription antitermination protein NusG [Helicobacter bizzozeronii CCUG 35545]|nr:Transcription antitermination protein NusG [Helicobacter bizzozeronii CCUG 35545]